MRFLQKYFKGVWNAKQLRQLCGFLQFCALRYAAARLAVEEMPRPSIEDIWRWRVPLLWHDDESGDVSRAYISENLYFFVSTVYKCCRLNLKTGTYAGKFALLGAIPVVEDSEEDLETLKLRARFWLEDIVARVLGVERKKRL